MTEVTMPSGAILKLNPAPFPEAKALFQAVLEEMKPVDISSKRQVAELFKDSACAVFASRKVEACLEKCLASCQYGPSELKIDKNSFDKPENREDFVPVCIEVARENLTPFMKGLYAGFAQFLTMMQKDQE